MNANTFCKSFWTSSCSHATATANASRAARDDDKSNICARTRVPLRSSSTSTSSASTFTSAALTKEPALSARLIGNEPSRIRMETTALGLRLGALLLPKAFSAFTSLLTINPPATFFCAYSSTKIKTVCTSPRRMRAASTLDKASCNLRSLACAVVRNGFELPSNHACIPPNEFADDGVGAPTAPD